MRFHFQCVLSIFHLKMWFLCGCWCPQVEIFFPVFLVVTIYPAFYSVCINFDTNNEKRSLMMCMNVRKSCEKEKTSSFDGRESKRADLFSILYFALCDPSNLILLAYTHTQYVCVSDVWSGRQQQQRRLITIMRMQFNQRLTKTFRISVERYSEISFNFILLHWCLLWMCECGWWCFLFLARIMAKMTKENVHWHGNLSPIMTIRLHLFFGFGMFGFFSS